MWKLLDSIIQKLYTKVDQKFSGMIVKIRRPGQGILTEYVLNHGGELSTDQDEADREVGLIGAFHDLRLEYLDCPAPKADGLNGEKHRYTPWYGWGREGDKEAGVPPASHTAYHCNSFHGEIPWRSFHQSDWPCAECGHPPADHSEHEGWISCSHGKYTNDKGHVCFPCNCGNNIGR